MKIVRRCCLMGAGVRTFRLVVRRGEGAKDGKLAACVASARFDAWHRKDAREGLARAPRIRVARADIVKFRRYVVRVVRSEATCVLL